MRLLCVLALLPTTAFAESTCNFAAYAPGGQSWDIAVHQDPSFKSPVVGTLQRGIAGTDTETTVAEFNVGKMTDGWAWISGIQNPDGVTPTPNGWIHGAYVRFVAQTEIAFAAPDPASDQVYVGHGWAFSEQLLDCDGEWALIRFDVFTENMKELSGQVTGWVRGICANQWTTCDGLYGDTM